LFRSQFMWLSWFSLAAKPGKSERRQSAFRIHDVESMHLILLHIKEI
jgi:hypothetical protein